MEFRLVLGEDMKLTSSGEVVIRQGTHLMDTIVIELGGKYQGAQAYLEFDLPKNRKHVTNIMDISGDIRYGVPEDVTANYGFGYMQLTILAGETLEKSALYAFEITSSICASSHYSGKDKHDFFFNVNEVLKDSKIQTNESKKATENAKKSISDINTLKTDIETKLASGAFKGEKGDAGTDGRDGKDGIDGANGTNGTNGVNGIDGVNGQDGITPHIGANGNWYFGSEDSGVKAIGKDGKDGKDAVIEFAQDRGPATDVAASQAFVTNEINKLFEHTMYWKGKQTIENLFPLSDKAIFGFVFAYELTTNNFAFAAVSKPASKSGSESCAQINMIMSRELQIMIKNDTNLHINRVQRSGYLRVKAMYTELD